MKAMARLRAGAATILVMPHKKITPFEGPYGTTNGEQVCSHYRPFPGGSQALCEQQHEQERHRWLIQPDSQPNGRKRLCPSMKASRHDQRSTFFDDP